MSDSHDSKAPDREAMQRAVSEFLRAAGVPLDDPELDLTPERVAAAWADEFLDGYRRTVREALGVLSNAPSGGGLVLVTHLDYTGVCPHHLLPYRGMAHVAYLPGEHVAGFSRLAAVVDVLAHRLTLQETLARDVARSLVDELGARGAGVVLEAEQPCMQMRGQKRVRSRAAVQALAGEFDEALMERLWAAVRAGSPRSGE